MTSCSLYIFTHFGEEPTVLCLIYHTAVHDVMYKKIVVFILTPIIIANLTSYVIFRRVRKMQIINPTKLELHSAHARIELRLVMCSLGWGFPVIPSEHQHIPLQGTRHFFIQPLFLSMCYHFSPHCIIFTFNFSNFSLCCTHICFIRLSQQTAIVLLNNFKYHKCMFLFSHQSHATSYF